MRLDRNLRPDENILVLDSDGSRIGHMGFRAAQTLATSRELDLVIVSHQNGLTIGKIMDEGKWRYHQKKRSKRKKLPPTKEVRFHINTDQHDVDIKLSRIQKFLSKGSDVRITFELKGRDRSYSELARGKISSILTQLGSIRQEKVRSTPSSVSVMIHPGN